MNASFEDNVTLILFATEYSYGPCSSSTLQNTVPILCHVIWLNEASQMHSKVLSLNMVDIFAIATKI